MHCSPASLHNNISFNVAELSWNSSRWSIVLSVLALREAMYKGVLLHKNNFSLVHDAVVISPSSIFDLNH